MMRYAFIAVGTVLVGILVVIGLAFFTLAEHTSLPIRGTSMSAPVQIDLPQALQNQYISFGAHTFQLEIADTYTARLRGLSGRVTLPRGTGLLFVFPDDERHGMWMKEMLFPIDIVWLDKNLRVVHVVEGVAPESYPAESFVPPTPARYVLELNVGEVAGAGIGVGVQGVLSTR